MTSALTGLLARVRERWDRAYTARAATALLNAGIITSPPTRVRSFPDEPGYIGYRATTRNDVAGGLSLDSEERALRTCIAEALERHVWGHDTSLLSGVEASYDDLVARGIRALDPSIILGAQHRLSATVRTLTTTWIPMRDSRARGLMQVPVRYISAASQARTLELSFPTSTTGLATHPSKPEALLGGILECIERDAFTCAWVFNRTLARLPLTSALLDEPRFRSYVSRLERYGFRVHVIVLPTDAPTYAVLVCLEDRHALHCTVPMPFLTVGTAAGSSLVRAAEKALLEAVRARSNARYRYAGNTDILAKESRDLTHTDRGVYWMNTQRAMRDLAFLIQGDEQDIEPAAWDRETPARHLARLHAWASEARQDILTFDFTFAASNALGWHVILTRMPRLQQLYLTESDPMLNESRLAAYAKTQALSRSPSTAIPHPFI